MANYNLRYNLHLLKAMQEDRVSTTMTATQANTTTLIEYPSNGFVMPEKSVELVKLALNTEDGVTRAKYLGKPINVAARAEVLKAPHVELLVLLLEVVHVTPVEYDLILLEAGETIPKNYSFVSVIQGTNKLLYFKEV